MIADLSLSPGPDFSFGTDEDSGEKIHQQVSKQLQSPKVFENRYYDFQVEMERGRRDCALTGGRGSFSVV
jgi:hypothetical protein